MRSHLILAPSAFVLLDETQTAPPRDHFLVFSLRVSAHSPAPMLARPPSRLGVRGSAPLEEVVYCAIVSAITPYPRTASTQAIRQWCANRNTSAYTIANVAARRRPNIS